MANCRVSLVLVSHYLLVCLPRGTSEFVKNKRFEYLLIFCNSQEFETCAVPDCRLSPDLARPVARYGVFRETTDGAAMADDGDTNDTNVSA
jgi:hypothetical protein